MHELSIITSLIEQIEQICKKQGKDCVSKIDLRIGSLEHINMETFLFMFEQVKEGTCVRQAKIDLIIEPTKIRCRKCHNVYTPEDSIWLCPYCNEVGGEIVQGTEIILEAVHFDD
ncbi:MAG: hydrogenase maturation nickel metallochaperone HypA [Candidatus Hydrogenedens sp.]